MNRAGLLALLLGATGCVKMSEIVVTDRVTALEEQAGGSFEELELKLTRSGIAPRPLPLTPEQLAVLGLTKPEKLRDPDLTPADLIDRALRQRCVGEGRDGLLVETPQACRGAVDREALARAIEATNRARTALWGWLRQERPGATEQEVQRAWTDAHRRGVVCGGWVQGPDGTWEARAC
jgi:Xaa-Pro aminopeptidase